MDWVGLKIAALLTMGGAIAGVTLFQIAAGRIKTREIGPRFAAALGAVLAGLTFMPELAEYSQWLVGVGSVAIIGASLQTARNARLDAKERHKQLS